MSNFKGVSFEEEDSYTLDDALEEVRRGDVIIYESAEDFLNHLRREIQDWNAVVIHKGTQTLS